MGFNIITEKPFWYIIFCIALGVGISIILYRKDRTLSEVHPWIKRTLAILRAIVITFIAFLLLTPLLKSISHEKEKPIVIIAQDNSSSIVTNKDSAFYRKEYAAKLNALIDELGKKYDIKTLNWGDHVSDKIDYSYNEKQTDFSDLMSEINVQYSNRNVGAIVIASDGLYNRGSNPVYASASLKVPVYTIALGDSSIQRDLFISKVNFNKTAYLGNTFPIEVSLTARQLSGAATTLTVSLDSLSLFTRNISISGNQFTQTIPVYLEAKTKGIHHYKISLAPVSGEMTTVNNVKDIFVEVLESKQKILIVANAPHPDLAAFKNAIESNENYEVKTVMADKFDPARAGLNEYNLIIVHELPSRDKVAADVLSKISSAKIPTLYVLGAQTSETAFNAQSAGLEIDGSLNKTNDVVPALSPDFSLFTVSDETRATMQQFPPLLCPFGDYREKANVYVMLKQQIGSVVSNKPMLMFNESSDRKIGVLAGEGIWRWRLSDFQLKGNFNASNEIITKTIQYLATRENKSHFRVISKNNFAENEPITFDAEVYNDNYEMVNTPDVTISITNADKKSFPFTFSKTEKSYSLNAGFFPSGTYHYKATAKLGDKIYNSDGEFSVSALQVEQSETVADHQLMYALAHKNGGEMYYPNQLDQLAKALEARDDIKTVSYTHIKMQDLVNMKWVFFLLLLLLSAEWFLRKRNGAY